GLVARARNLRGEASNRGQALAALGCGVVALVVSGILVGQEAAYLSGHPGLVHNIAQCRAQAHTAKAAAACVRQLTHAIQGH
ncbi:MAG: hypothetical protein ACRDYY_04870, partial [Acidimicrobiales bacterium]